MGSKNARYLVEQSDLLLMLGVTLNDIDTGIYTAKLDPHHMIRAALNEVVISAHRYPRVALADFLTALVGSVKTRSEGFSLTPVALATSGFPKPNQPITTARLIERLNQSLSANMVVVCDVGDCQFAAIDLRVHEQSEFLASSFSIPLWVLPCLPHSARKLPALTVAYSYWSAMALFK
jgi:TPP-dependent 2-oxoacid decarboxylase